MSHPPPTKAQWDTLGTLLSEDRTGAWTDLSLTLPFTINEADRLIIELTRRRNLP